MNGPLQLTPVSDRTTTVYLFAITLAGCALALLMPPLSGLDEPWHWLRAVQIADGEFLARKFGPNNWGGAVDQGASEFVVWILNEFKTKEPIQVEALQRLLAEFSERPFNQSEVIFSSTAAFSPLAYLPMAAAIKVARLFGADLLQQIWAARLANLLIYLIGLVGVLRLLPCARFAALALCTIPGALYLAASISADPINFIMPALLVAICLRLRLDSTWTPRFWRPTLALLVILLALLKPTLVPLAVLPLLIPAHRFGGSRAKRHFLIAVVALAVAVALAWNIAYPFVPGSYWGMGANPAEAMATIFGDLPGALQTFYSTVRGSAAVWWMEAYGRFGGHAAPYSRMTPSVLDWIGLSLVLALIPTTRNPRFDPLGAAFLILLAIGSAALVLLAFWIGFTRPGAPIIQGVQGRYFLVPELMAVLAIAVVAPPRFAAAWLRSPLLIAVLACHLSTVFLVLQYFQAVWPVSAVEALYTPRPVNDSISTPIPIQIGEILGGTNVGATKEPGEPNHAGKPGGRSVWWTFTAPIKGRVTLSTAGSDFDTLLAVYSGTAIDDLTLIASNDDTGTTADSVFSAQSLLSFDVEADRTYLIAVDGHRGESGRVMLSMSKLDGATSIVVASWPNAARIAVGAPLTVLASVINSGHAIAVGCSVKLPGHIPASVDYQTADPKTNEPVGTRNMPVDIAVGQAQPLLVLITPQEAFTSDVAPVFDCQTSAPAPTATGYNTIYITAETLSPDARGATAILAAVTPNVATTAVDSTLMVLASIVNKGSAAAIGCSIALAPDIAASMDYQATDPSTNVPVGNRNTPMDIAAGQTQSFALMITVKEAFRSELAPVFACRNSAPAPLANGVNTIQITVRAR